MFIELVGVALFPIMMKQLRTLYSTQIVSVDDLVKHRIEEFEKIVIKNNYQN